MGAQLVLDDYRHVLELLQRVLGREVDVEDYPVIHPFALTAIAALARNAGNESVRLRPCNLAHAGSRWAWDGMGLNELMEEVQPKVPGEAGRTAKLRRINEKTTVSKHAKKMASLVSPQSDEIQKTLTYVFDELLRNVIQHSCDPLGGVACAQRMEAMHVYSHRVIQLAVVDTGIGIQASISRSSEVDIGPHEALLMSMEPHVSGAFQAGCYGSEENAGMGLFVVTEIVKRTAGRLLLASRGGALYLQGDPEYQQDHRFEKCEDGFPGTLVAFEIPVLGYSESAIPEFEFQDLLSVILDAADMKRPATVTSPVLEFSAAPVDSRRLMASQAIGNLVGTEQMRATILRDLVRKRSICIDFLNVRLMTQSQAHSLLFEPIRVARSLGQKLWISNASSEVSTVLRFLHGYALVGLGGSAEE